MRAKARRSHGPISGRRTAAGPRRRRVQMPFLRRSGPVVPVGPPFFGRLPGVLPRCRLRVLIGGAGAGIGTACGAPAAVPERADQEGSHDHPGDDQEERRGTVGCEGKRSAHEGCLPRLPPRSQNPRGQGQRARRVQFRARAAGRMRAPMWVSVMRRAASARSRWMWATASEATVTARWRMWASLG